MSSNFREFVNDLENEGELHRVTEEVDPVLEITEIAIRAQKENKPAILFENVKGSKYPLAINTFASDKRIEIALGQNPEEIGNELLNFIEAMRPPKIKEMRGKITIIAVNNDNFAAASLFLKLSVTITRAIDIQAAAPKPWIILKKSRQ